MSPITLLPFLCLPFLPAQVPDTEQFNCESTEGWALLDFGGQKPSGATLSIVGVKLAFQYDRSILSPLVHSPLLTELREIRLSIRSEVETMLALAVEDRDGATFNYGFPLPAGRWTTVTARPSDFLLNEDSRVKKKKMDARRLGAGYALLDLGAALGATGENTLTLDNVVIERAPFPHAAGDLVVDRTMEISQSASREGRLTLKKGAHLKITAPRFSLRGHIVVEDATLEISGGVFLMPQLYNHELRLTFRGSSRFILRNAFFVSRSPISLEMLDASSFDMVNSECQGGVTCSMTEKSRITLSQAKSPGEFIIIPGATMTIEDSSFVILWLSLGANARGNLSLPPGEKVADWSSGHGLNIRVKNTEQVIWCIVSSPESDATVERTDLYGAGIYFGGNARASFRDIHNGRSLRDHLLAASDRKLRFVESRVKAWNFYANENAQVQLEDCTFGESLAFGEGQVEIRNSTCDGSGGYIGTENQSQMRLVKCKVQSLVVARDDSSMTLEDCEVRGDVRAAGRATVKLIRTRVQGRVESDPGAKLIQE